MSQYIDFSWYKRAQDSIAHAALTNSKRPETFVKGIYPTHIESAKGCHVVANGRRYVDFICGLGTNLLGYGNEEIATEIYKYALKGVSPSLSTQLEVTVAEKIKQFIPWVDQVRFLKTGSDACSASVRIARTFTGKSEVYSEGYHGWHDEFVSLTPPALGVPSANGTYISRVRNNQPISILEPIELDNSKERIEYLRSFKDSFVIFDEVITGFRYLKHSASRHHGIEPDLICLGKSIANGSSLSVVAGKREVMQCDEYFVSSTFAGETTSLAACLKTMELLQSKYNIDDLWAAGQRFINEFNSFYSGVQLKGYATRARLEGDPLHKALFMQEAAKANILFGPSWFISFAHIGIVDDVLKTCELIMLKIKKGMAKLEGEMPKSPFAEKARKQ